MVGGDKMSHDQKGFKMAAKVKMAAETRVLMEDFFFFFKIFFLDAKWHQDSKTVFIFYVRFFVTEFHPFLYISPSAKEQNLNFSVQYQILSCDNVVSYVLWAGESISEVCLLI